MAALAFDDLNELGALNPRVNYPLATSVPGDANGDGRVYAADLIVVRGQFGRTGSAISPAGADRNGDNRIDAADVGIVTRILTP